MATAAKKSETTSTPTLVKTASVSLRAPKDRESAVSLGAMLTYSKAPPKEIEAWFKTNKISGKRAAEIHSHLGPDLQPQVAVEAVAKAGPKGRAALKLGESRAYRVALSGSGNENHPSCRIPVGLIGGKNKGEVVATFFEGGKWPAEAPKGNFVVIVSK